MPRDDEKLLRQLSIVSFLLTRRRPVTAYEVKSSVEGYALMSDETFTRRFHSDREQLGQAGITIESTRGIGPEDPEVYYLPEQNYSLPDLGLTQSELATLAVSVGLLDGRFAYARPLRLALVNLTGGRVDEATEGPEGVPVLIAPDDEVEQGGDRLTRLDAAVSRGKTVLFPYHSVNRDEETVRTVDPYSLFLIGGRWYLVGRDHERDDVRMFRVGRMTGPIRFATKKVRDFSVPSDYDPEEYRVRPPWFLGPPQGEARIWIDRQLAWWVERSFPHIDRETASDQGDMVFRTPYSHDEALLAWVIRLGARAELLEPPSLRRQLVKCLESIASTHAETTHREDNSHGSSPDV